MKLSTSADGLAQRIAVILKTGARPLNFFRNFAASEAVFERAVGLLFIRGQVKFTGKKQGRRLARA